MPTPRKSKAELALSGTLGDHPARYRDRFSQVQSGPPIGRPPSHFNPPQRAVWNEILRFSPPGLLTKHDRISLEVAVGLLIRIRQGDAKTSEVNALTALMARLAMTPADRKRMNYEQPATQELPVDENDPWAEFLN